MDCGRKHIAVAIDGPVGVGKSTVARHVAKELGFTYVDTGAMYRAIAYYLVQKDIDIHCEKAVCQMVQDVEIGLDDEQRVFVCGEDVTDMIRTQSISASTSVTAAYKCVRMKLVDMQRKFAASADVVMDGRDIGSCVLPNADLKIYLDADARIRAKRRMEELVTKGQTVAFDDVLKETVERDERDMNRKESPLVKTEGAILIDTGTKSVRDVVTEILEKARQA